MGQPISFSFNCTSPPPGVNFVSGPPVRGTLNIVSSCLSVLILSIWKIQVFRPQIKVDEPEDLSRKSHVDERITYPQSTVDFCGLSLEDRIIQVYSTIVAPIHNFQCAMYDFLRHRSARQKILDQAGENRLDMSSAQIYYVLNRGLYLMCHTLDYSDPQTIDEQDLDLVSQRQLRPSRPSRGVSRRPSRWITLGLPNDVLHDEFVLLTTESILYLYRIGVLDSLPALTIREVDFRNTSDTLVQVLAAVQTCALIIQVILRSVKHIAVTQLEVLTLAFAVAALLTRAFDQYRPVNIRRATVVHAKRILTVTEYTTLIDMERETNSPLADETRSLLVSTFFLVRTVYGLLHCIAWNATFPTPTERTLWRVSSIVVTCAAFVHLVFPLSGLVYTHGPFKLRFMSIWNKTFATIRFFLIVESVRALFYQAPDAFVVV